MELILVLGLVALAALAIVRRVRRGLAPGRGGGGCGCGRVASGPACGGLPKREA